MLSVVIILLPFAVLQSLVAIIFLGKKLDIKDSEVYFWRSDNAVFQPSTPLRRQQTLAKLNSQRSLNNIDAEIEMALPIPLKTTGNTNTTEGGAQPQRGKMTRVAESDEEVSEVEHFEDRSGARL